MGNTSKKKILESLTADCENCFGLCCVALPYSKSADFACDKDSGIPCPHLQSDYRCKIHNRLREEGFRGCSAYECFGAGQKVSQVTYKGFDWKGKTESAREMFNVFPIMHQLHEMLYYINQAINRDEAQAINKELRAAFEETERLTYLDPKFILTLDVINHRGNVNELLLKTSELVRAKTSNKKNRSKDLIGVSLKGADLRGANLRGALLIAADLRNSDMRMADLIGADFRDADLRGADLSESIFLTQAQVNAAKGDRYTKLPSELEIPPHWITQ